MGEGVVAGVRRGGRGVWRRVAHGQRRKGRQAESEPVSARETWTGNYEADHGTRVFSPAPAPPMPRDDLRGPLKFLSCAGILVRNTRIVNPRASCFCG